ncbi:MAG: hypothetical protein QOG49_1825 [Frankiaceae bacterium]|jgi:hypothetical protein|nr:hypothetical protein [Frankiaceae bacterium]
MKYMLMMFGSQADMMASASPDWVAEMITFMVAFDDELRSAGELVIAEGLADGTEAKLVRHGDGGPMTTDGPFADAKESLIGFWIVDVDTPQRALDIAAQVAVYSGVVEVRQVMDAPPQV